MSLRSNAKRVAPCAVLTVQPEENPSWTQACKSKESYRVLCDSVTSTLTVQEPADREVAKILGGPTTPEVFYHYLLESFPLEPEASKIVRLRGWVAEKMTDSSPLLSKPSSLRHLSQRLVTPYACRRSK